MTTANQRRQIVVGIDGSEGARLALSWAWAEATVWDADLTVVHAWAPPAPVSEIAVMAVPVDEQIYEQAARDVLSHSLQQLEADGADASRLQGRTLRGYPSSVLLEESSGADLLVVGSRGRGGFAGLLLGSVSQQCIHHTHRPVAVIPETALPPGNEDVVVGVDGSDTSWGALRWAVDEAARRGARLAVVHAWSTPYAVPPGGIGIAPIHHQDFVDQSERLLHEMVDGTLARAERRPVDVELLPIEEPAAPALLHRAKGAGLLVVGSRGRGGFAGLVLGSVSQQCLHHATCAVVVIPPPQ